MIKIVLIKFRESRSCIYITVVFHGTWIPADIIRIILSRNITLQWTIQQNTSFLLKY